MELTWIRRHGPHLSLFPQDGVTPVLLLLAAYSCSVLCLDTPAPDHLHASITFLRFLLKRHLSEGESLLPPPLSILFCLRRSQRLPGIHTAPVTAPCSDSRNRQEAPRGRECVLLLAVSPAPRPAPKAAQSLESTSYQLQYQH